MAYATITTTTTTTARYNPPPPAGLGIASPLSEGASRDGSEGFDSDHAHSVEGKLSLEIPLCSYRTVSIVKCAKRGLFLRGTASRMFIGTFFPNSAGLRRKRKKNRCAGAGTGEPMAPTPSSDKFYSAPVYTSPFSAFGLFLENPEWEEE